MSLTDLYAAVRAATRAPADWDTTVDTVVASVRPHLPHRRDVLAQLPIGARHGHEFSVPLHVEPDGTFSVVAFVSRPGQATSVHDHTTWCVVAVIDGAEREERFRLGRAGTCLEPIGDRVDESGAVSGFAPPGDIHRVRNCGAAVGVSLHIYGTDLRRTGSSVRRTYDLPIVTPTKEQV